MTILKNFFSTLTRRGYFVLCCISIGFAVLVYTYVTHSSNDFQRAFQTYLPIEKTYVAAAYVPGVPDNPIRQHLNGILSKVLAQPMTPKERLALAEEGIAVLKDAEKQIDIIGDDGEKVQNAIKYMEEKASTPGALLARQQAARIIALAKQQFSIVSDIRGLSYRANFSTGEIFNRIVLDKGELTREYVAELNRDIPDVETQFNKRTNLYTQLESVTAKIEREASSL